MSRFCFGNTFGLKMVQFNRFSVKALHQADRKTSLSNATKVTGNPQSPIKNADVYSLDVPAVHG